MNNSPQSIFTAPNPHTSTPLPATVFSNVDGGERALNPPDHCVARENINSSTHDFAKTSASTAQEHIKSSTSDSLEGLRWKFGATAELSQTSAAPPASTVSTDASLADTSATGPLLRGNKRPLIPDFPKPPSPGEWQSHKRARVHIRPRHTLDPAASHKDSAVHLEPPSPLFFSGNPRRKPNLPPRFTSSEAEATMLRNATVDDRVGIRTVKMARGSINVGSSPPHNAGTLASKAFTEKPSLLAASSSAQNEQETSGDIQALSQVGIVELLERDERPTFIIDLANSVNYQPGQLQIIFANSSLKAYNGLHDMITGRFAEDYHSLGTPTIFPEFKAWATSFVKNNESLDVCLPSFLYGGVIWSCSTLRKRFRFISGSQHIGPGSINSGPPSVGTPAISSYMIPDSENHLHVRADGAGGSHVEPSDYFGNFGIESPLSHKSPSPPHSPQQMEDTRNNHTPLANGFELNTDSERISYSQQASPLGRRHCETVLGAATVAQVDASKTPDLYQEFFDWTRLPNTPALPRHIQFARSVDWGATSLGPISKWPSALRIMSNLIMASPHPAAMYWGDDFVAIYNEAYVLLAGQKHPRLMGMSYGVAWAEIWDGVKEIFANAKSTGLATMKDDDCLFMERNGYLEETYFSWSIIPLVGEDGSVVGLYNPAFEKTRRKIAERRMLTLREVGEKIAAAREVRAFWGQVLKGLEDNERDTPFVLLYSVTEDIDSDVSSVHSASTVGYKQCILEGTLPPIPENHKACPAQIDLKTGTEGFAPSFREAMATDRPVLLEVDKGTLDVSMMEGINWRGFGELPRAAVVCPIHPTLGDSNSILGFLVMGINPRRPYDDDYNLFVQLLSRQLATSMASVVLFEEEIRRGQRAAKMAAQDRIELSAQLAARTQEAVESETKFTRMAEFAPVGMFIADSNGKLTYCNDMFYEISRHPKEVDNADEWGNAVEDDDKELVSEWWTNVIVNKVPMTAEFRFKVPWEGRSGIKGETWVLASAYPEKDEDESLKSVFGSITNISQQKWAEDFQKRRMEEAIEMKRQQERFIDTTSHEMRNPLSAIVQCADEISTSLSEYRANTKGNPLPLELLDSNIDAAQTIALCANHQTRIVTDILTLSKLDSALLLVTPVDTRPLSVVQQNVKMFQGELQTADITCRIETDLSWGQLGIDWVKLDPSRLLQVLINLTTNAIKFTTGQPKRNITIKLSAFSERPPRKSNPLVSYIPARPKRQESMGGADWGTGEEVFVHFAVTDTGRGLSDSEKKSLFLRFSQANPRTHVQYGGSGLGLFISRELVELQGGEIGVSSESGKGSTFAFYVRARKSSEPKEEPEQPRNAIGSVPRTLPSGATVLGAPGLQTATAADIGLMPVKSRSEELRVLIVEDNLVNQRVLQKQLRNLGCAVYVANHGGECIERLKESRFWVDHEDHGLQLSVILMDLEMPIMDGLTCTRKIRELERRGDITRHVPIIAVTANARMEQINTALEAGMDDVVSKPFRIPDLIPKIDALVRKFKDAIPEVELESLTHEA